MKLLNIVFAIAVLLLVLQVRPYTASRILYEQEEKIVAESLQRGPVPPSGPSGCTYIPGGGGPNCPVQEMHFAGDALPRASAYPRLMVQFGVATSQN
ncbi:hypothetical protein AAG906_024960 [Vitis piasezkii]